MHGTVLRRWVRERMGDPQQAFPGQGQMKPDQLELERLRREVTKLNAERDILKKSAADSTGQCNTTWFRPRWRLSRLGWKWYGTSRTTGDDRDTERRGVAAVANG